MNFPPPVEPVVVGIDGSKHALRAARWAALEAASRDTTLRLVYVIGSEDTERQESIDRAQHALHKAWKALAATHINVKLESEILSGNPAQRLAEESRRVAVVAVGDRGTHDTPDGPRGSTATEVARKASGTVAIIRRTHREFDHRKWIVAVLGESASATAVLRAAEVDSAWRHAPILLLEPWSHSGEPADVRHPVHAALERYLRATDNGHLESVTLAMPGHLGNLLRQSACIDQLVIVPGDDRELVAELTSDDMRKTLKGSDCTLLFVRPSHCVPNGDVDARQQNSIELVTAAQP